MDKKIGVLGAGWLGRPLVERLLAEDFTVHATSRDADKLERLKEAGAEPFVVDLPHQLPPSFFTGLRDLVITLPPGGRKWKAQATELYVERLSTLLPFLRESPQLRIIYCSSTGVYGSAKGQVDEHSPVQPDTFSSRAVVAAEQLLAPFQQRLTILRFAGLVGPGRHPGNFYGGKNYPLSQSDAPVNLVHQSDAVEALCLTLATPSINGIYNVCSAAHPSKGSFYGAAAGAIHLDIGAKIAGGGDGKIINSGKLRERGWLPKYDELKVFLPDG